MPFGDHIRTVQLAEPWDWAGTREPKTRRVTVPEVEAPWWWSEYLTDEWKRRNRYQQQPRDGRTGLQKAEDEWKLQRWRWSAAEPHAADGPRHDVWGPR